MLFSVLFTSVKFQTLLLHPSGSPAMGTQATLLVDACVVRLVKLHIDFSLPFPSFHLEVARMRRVGWVIIDSWYENTCVIIK